MDYSQYAQYANMGGGSGGGSSGTGQQSSAARSGINFGSTETQSWVIPSILGAVVLLVALVLVSKN